VAGGDAALAQQLASAPPPLSSVEQSQRDLSDKRWTLEHGGARAEGAPARAPREDVSPDELAAALGGLTAAGDAEMDSSSSEEELEEGWERVPTRKGGKKR